MAEDQEGSAIFPIYGDPVRNILDNAEFDLSEPVYLYLYETNRWNTEYDSRYYPKL